MPSEVARLYDLVASGKWEEARDLHYHLLPMNDILFIETNPVPAKTAMGLMGGCSAEVRPPHAPPSKIVGFALTYRDHAAELGIDAPPDPAVFFKPPSGLVGHLAPVVY